MKIAILLTAAAMAFAAPALAEASERIVFIRHGEKPPKGLGQLDCKGLNRALALPAWVERAFGRPDAIFAPNPSAPKPDMGVAYDYVRPLMTIEPTAIAFGLPVHAEIGFADVEGLRKALEAPEYAQALVLVGWEHKIIDVVVRDILAAHGGDASQVPAWSDADFDSVDVVTLAAGQPAQFERLREGLDGQPEACPRP